MQQSTAVDTQTATERKHRSVSRMRQEIPAHITQGEPPGPKYVYIHVQRTKPHYQSGRVSMAIPAPAHVQQQHVCISDSHHTSTIESTEHLCCPQKPVTGSSAAVAHYVITREPLLRGQPSDCVPQNSASVCYVTPLLCDTALNCAVSSHRENRPTSWLRVAAVPLTQA
jgi:hypothetical protein